MMIIPKVNYFKKVPVQLPEKRILSRLGYSKHRTTLDERQQAIVKEAMIAGFSLCEPHGVWCRIKIESIANSEILLDNGMRIISKSLCKLLANSIEVLVMGVTVGKPIVDAVQDAMKNEPAKGVIYDAVGSETVDAAMQWIHDYLRRSFVRSFETVTKQRFSPGYGDLELVVQDSLFKVLHLDYLGVALTERYMLIPEKTVMGIAGIEK